MLSKREAATELLQRREARGNLAGYMSFTNHQYKRGFFSDTVCASLDQFILDVMDGIRPILILQAPPQSGKSEIVSRKLPAFLLGKYPHLRLGAASYGDLLANAMAQDVRRTLASEEHSRLFPVAMDKQKYAVNRMGEFTAPADREAM